MTFWGEVRNMDGELAKEGEGLTVMLIDGLRGKEEPAERPGNEGSILEFAGAVFDRLWKR